MISPKPPGDLEAMSHPVCVLDDDKGTKITSRPRDSWDILEQEESRIGLEIGITRRLSPLSGGGDQNVALEHQDPSPTPDLGRGWNQVEEDGNQQ